MSEHDRASKDQSRDWDRGGAEQNPMIISDHWPIHKTQGRSDNWVVEEQNKIAPQRTRREWKSWTRGKTCSCDVCGNKCQLPALPFPMLKPEKLQSIEEQSRVARMALQYRHGRGRRKLWELSRWWHQSFVEEEFPCWCGKRLSQEPHLLVARG